MRTNLRRVAVVFSGGPAPAANAVIAAVCSTLKRRGVEVVGLLHGYSGFDDYGSDRPLVEGEHFQLIRDDALRGLRNQRGVLLGTSRANPGKAVRNVADLEDASRTAGLERVIAGLSSLGVDGLVSIGGDDTLRTANLLHRYQQHRAGGPVVRVVHVPKTIDNDYRGIDFTFGFFTAVDVMAKELLNLRADAMATRSYFIVETMGRRAGWLAYGVAQAGEAHMVIGVEDVVDSLALANPNGEPKLNLDALCEHIVSLICVREQRGKAYGTVVLAEGLAECLPDSLLEGIARDEHGHVSLGKLNLASLVAKLVAEKYEARTGQRKKLNAVQLGYEARCAAPHAFDVVLGSQLGFGAYRALIELGLSGHMVSVSGQLELNFVPFEQLMDPTTLRADVRFIDRKSDFFRLARELETQLRPQEALSKDR